MSPSCFEYPIYFWQLLSGFRTMHEARYAEFRLRDTRPFLTERFPLQILDLANGRLRPQYALLKACGHRVCGIDLANHPQTSVINFIYRLARWLYTWKSAIPARILADQTLVCGDVAQLPFRANSFDLVTSVAAFEHFLDVPAVVAELARIMRPGAVLWVCVHLFTCPSGGHNITFTQIPLRKMPRGIAPWDHLRKRYLPFHVPLNEWRQDQYVGEIGKHFEILKRYCAIREGEEFLTPALEEELSCYRRDELTCGAYVIVARKPH